MERIREQTRLAKWENSKAARIPNKIIRQLKLDDNQYMIITIETDPLFCHPLERTQSIFMNSLRTGKMTENAITNLI